MTAWITLLFVAINSFIAGTLLIGSFELVMAWFMDEHLPINALRAAMRKAPRAITDSIIKGVFLWLALVLIGIVASSVGHNVNLWLGVYLGMFIMAYIMRMFDWALGDEEDANPLPLVSVVGVGAMGMALFAPDKLTIYAGFVLGVLTVFHMSRFIFFFCMRFVQLLPYDRRA